MIENIDTSLIDWSRAQFALTAMYHWLFVPLCSVDVGAGSYCRDYGDDLLSDR